MVSSLARDRSNHRLDGPERPIGHATLPASAAIAECSQTDEHRIRILNPYDCEDAKLLSAIYGISVLEVMHAFDDFLSGRPLY